MDGLQNSPVQGWEARIPRAIMARIGPTTAEQTAPTMRMAAEREALVAKRADIVDRQRKLLALVEHGDVAAGTLRDRLKEMQAEADTIEWQADDLAGGGGTSAFLVAIRCAPCPSNVFQRPPVDQP